MEATTISDLMINYYDNFVHDMGRGRGKQKIDGVAAALVNKQTWQEKLQLYFMRIKQQQPTTTTTTN